MTDIADRLDAIHRRHGAGAVGWYFGNPAPSATPTSCGWSP